MQQLGQLMVNDDVLECRFNQVFSQEDIALIMEQWLSKVPTLRCIETITGADRVNYRLRFNEEILIANFDCCSQSCWVEAELPDHKTLITAFSNQLINVTGYA